MKFIATFAIIFLSACGPGSLPEEVVEDIEVIQAYKIFMTGKYTSVSADCSQAFLALGVSQINDSEIVCDIGDIKQVEAGVFVLAGKNCSAEGHKLSDFSFSINNNKDGTITYKNSGESVWQKLKKCPRE